MNLNSPSRILNKIPGLPVAKRDTYINDLNKLTEIELLEVKQRQEKLLTNKVKLQRLPDKGKRIHDLYEKVKLEYERRSNVNTAALLFSELNISSKGKETIEKLEWNGKLGVSEDDVTTSDLLDSDDEQNLDPLKIIATGGMHKREVTVLSPEKSLITDDDLKEITSFNLEIKPEDTDLNINNNSINADYLNILIDGNLKEKLKKVVLNDEHTSSQSEKISSSDLCPFSEIDEHSRYVVSKTESKSSPKMEKFLPHRTTVSNVHDPQKERLRKRNKHWEVTAATPPPIQHNATQMLSFIESVDIQAKYLANMKKLQEEQAAIRLEAQMKRNNNRSILQLPKDLSKESFLTYRSPSNAIEGEKSFEKEPEVYDPTDLDTTAAVTYTVYES